MLNFTFKIFWSDFPTTQFTSDMAALESMRQSFADIDGVGVPMNDNTFLRYLKARNFNIDKAIAMLRGTIQWRLDFGIREEGGDGKVLTMAHWMDVLSVENSTGKMFVRGFDRVGHALLYMRPRHENTNNHDGNLKHLVYSMERAIAILDASGRGREKIILLIDYEGYSLMNSPPMKTSKAVLAILQDHYPERLHRAYCIRPPWVVNAFFNVISPFIDPVTRDKIVMVTGSSAAAVGAKLAKEIDVEILEKCLGGSDDRPFDSKIYLSSPFHIDFLTTLNTL